MKHLFDNITLKNLKANNRLVRSATWEGIANRDGSVTEEAYSIYDEIAKGGVGTIITGFTSVAANDYYFGGMMRLSDDALIPQYKKLTHIIHSQGIPVITQLALGAYYRPVGNSFEQVEPDDMTTEELHLVRDQFIDAALRAEKAGFDGVQIHVAHFFFLSRLVSPLVNHRTDEYGGSTENRTRLVTEIIKGIREKAPALHITAKINSNDFMAGGLDAAKASICPCTSVKPASIPSKSAATARPFPASVPIKTKPTSPPLRPSWQKPPTYRSSSSAG